MEDTSFAIHPGKQTNGTDSVFVPVGKVLEVNSDGARLELKCEHGYLTVLFYTNDIVRISFDPAKNPSKITSPAVILNPEPVKTTLDEAHDHLIFKSRELFVRIEKSTCLLSVEDNNGIGLFRDHRFGMGWNSCGHIIAHHELSEEMHFYGFGEKSGFLDKRDTKTTMWNTDVYAPHNPETEALYQSIPFFMSLKNGRAHGLFFDNTFKSYFDMRTDKDFYRYEAEGGILDFYVFNGPTPKEVLKQYTDLTGRMPIPPKWALGYHQSRYSYKTDAEVSELVATFRKRDIPLDAVHLDIHYMKDYRVFTFNPARFPSPGRLIEALKEDGVHVVPIVDPGVKEDPEYHAFRDGALGDHFCKYIDGDVFYGDVWPGKSAFPDFANEKVREWWGHLHQFYTDLGIEGIWNDMNEPAVFNETKTMDLKVMHRFDGELVTHREFHNLYGLMASIATYEGMKKLLNGKRPFVLTRAGFAGVQRYAAVWTGDNRSFWEHLEMAIPMLLNLGVSGVPFAGTDVGGFAYDSDGELLARWTQLGAFSPFFRNHSALDFARQEPWSYGEKYEEIIKKYIQLRYRFLPYIYTLFKEASSTGLPIMRPLFMEYPEDKKTYALHDQFLVGENVMIAPILRPGLTHRAVYFPDGEWVNYWTDEVIDGGKHHLVEAALDILPMFVKRGTVIPEGEVGKSTADICQTLTFHLYASEGCGSYTLYDDDGSTHGYQNGQFSELELNYQYDGKTITIDLEQSYWKFTPKWSNIKLKLHLVDEDTNVMLNGEPATISYANGIGEITFTVK
jgi:alpha-glucosidase